MSMTCTGEAREITVTLTGEIDHHAARQMMLDLDREIEHRFPRSLTLDFRRVTFMDSSGIALIMRTWRRMQEVGGSFTVCNVPRQAAKVFRAANVQKLVHMTFL